MGRHGPAARNRYALGVCTLCIVAGVNIPNTLLGLLEREPSHGYDLKRDYDLRSGAGGRCRSGRCTPRSAGSSATGHRGRAPSSPGRGPTASATPSPPTASPWSSSGWPSPSRARAPPADGAVRQGRARAGVRPAGGPVPRRPARRPPAPHARAHRPNAGRATWATRCSPTTRLFHLEADLRWIELTGRGSTAARGGAVVSDLAPRGPRASPARSAPPRPCAAPTSRRTPARSWPSWGPAARASRRCCTAWPASSPPTTARSGSTARRVDAAGRDRARSELRRERLRVRVPVRPARPRADRRSRTWRCRCCSAGRSARRAAVRAAGAWFGRLGPRRAGAPPARRAVRRPGPAGRAGPGAGHRARGACSPTSPPARSTRSPASR